MSRYFVTGGCGFIGSHLVDELLLQGHDVVVLDNLSSGNIHNLNKNAELITGDIDDRNLVIKTMSDCDGCFHLAAVASVQKSINHWVETNRTNLVGTITLLDIAKDINKNHPFSFVYASSAAVYGHSKNKPPYRETDELAPISPYGVDKLSGELQARIAGQIHQLPNICLRFFNVYGPRQNPDSDYSGVISILLNKIRTGQPFTLFGDGEQTRDFVWIDDVVHCLCLAMQHASTEAPVYNICSGAATSINQLIGTAGNILGTKPVIHHAPARTGDIRISTGDNALVKDKLSMSDFTDLNDGLKRLCGSL